MKKSMPTLIILAVFALSLTIVPGARASLIGVTNLNGAGGSMLTVGSDQWIGKEFTTGSGSWNLDSIVLSANQAGGGTHFTVGLYSNTGGQPGTLLTTLSGAAPTGPFNADYTYVDSSHTLLSQNTSYWVMFTSTDPSGFFLEANLAGNNAYTGLSGWSFADDAIFSPDTGTSWFAAGRGPLLAINVAGGGGGAVATPEPGTMMLMGSGVLGMLGFRRRELLAYFRK